VAAPDGAPIAWTLRLKGNRTQERVDGPGMMLRLCAQAEVENLRIGLYGASNETLRALTGELRRAFPKLEIAYAHSPPFRELTAAEDAAVCSAITEAGVGLLFVGLGCPKQEYWMARHRSLIPAVMLGVGAAFEFHAGTVSRAPRWMRENGLEWLYRMASQPRRLWRRYLFSNSIFLAKSAREAADSVVDRLRPPNP
jgi:N-acetylglucosaminyldiphosphoundecaprenol N-acetyl-beta-D-mannosaminyltransferase